MHELRILEVDREAEWAPLYTPFFYELACPAYWTEILNSEGHTSTQSREAALQKRVPQLRQHATAFLREHFTHIALYHSCRIMDEASYLTHGLLPSNTVELQRIARDLFGDTPQLEEAIRDMDSSGYRNHNHGKVYFFFARSGAVHIGGHYLESGSEYLRGLASRIGGNALAQLAARGRPALVRCQMPLTMLDDSDVSYAAMLPIRQHLTVRDPEAPAYVYALQGGHPTPTPYHQNS